MAEDLREDSGEFYPGGTVVPGGGGGGSSVIVDDTLTKDGENPVKSKGIWSAIWGSFTGTAASLYEWVTTELGKKQGKLKAGDNITIADDGTISASGGDVDVVAEIAGKEIKPSSVVMELDAGGWIAKAIKITPDSIYYVKYLNEDDVEKELSAPWAHILNSIPKYAFKDNGESGGTILLFPFTIRRVSGVGEDISISIASLEGSARDMVLVVDATVETHILWEDGATTFHPRGGDAANLEVVAGKRNVFFVTEVQPNVFMVARDELALPDAGGGE